MKIETLPLLRCLRCLNKSGSDLKILKTGEGIVKESHQVGQDLLTGTLQCQQCKKQYPVLAGVAILVDNIEDYFFYHAKGISQAVGLPLLEKLIPKKLFKIIQESLEELQSLEQQTEALEEDLESQRVNALYLMTHYLSAQQLSSDNVLFQSLIQQYWDQGPMQWTREQFRQECNNQNAVIVELGCSVGGWIRGLTEGSEYQSYLGVDSSFASIALARKLNVSLQQGDSMEVVIPGDLLNHLLGSSRQRSAVIQSRCLKGVDYIVAEIDRLPLRDHGFDVSIALNTLDMLEDPTQLPQIQKKHLKQSGVVLQCSPYIWTGKAAKKINAYLVHHRSKHQLKHLDRRQEQGSSMIEDSSEQTVVALYECSGFKVKQQVSQLPWLFFKHDRQMEVYGVHALFAANCPL